MADLVLTADVSSIRDAEKALKRFSDASEKLGRSVLNTASKVKSVSSGWDQANKLYKQGVLNSKALAAAQTELARELATLNGYTKSNGALNTQRALAELRAAQAARESARATEEAARAAQQAAQRQNELRMRYQEGYAAFARARNEMRGLREAMRAGIITTDQYRERVRLLREEMNRSGDAAQGAGRRMSRTGVVFQQAGYQIGDFAVQVQSGTHYMVALGQQLTQLVGVGAMLARSTAWIAAFSALGIIVPIATAVAGAFMRIKEESDGLKEAEENVKSLTSAVEEWKTAKAALDLGLSPDVYKGTKALEIAVENARENLKALRQDLLESGEGSVGKVVAQDILAYLGISGALKDLGVDIEVGSLEAQAQAALDKYNELSELLESLRQIEAEKKDEFVQKLDRELQLQKEIATYGKDSLNVADLRLQFEKEDLAAQARKLGFSEDEIAALVKKLSLTESIRKKLEETERSQKALLEDTSAAGDEMVKAFKAAKSLREEIGEGAAKALELAGVDITSGVDAAAKAAARLAANLNVSLGHAINIMNLNEEVKGRMVRRGVREGTIPPQALADLPQTTSEKAYEQLMAARRRAAELRERESSRGDSGGGAVQEDRIGALAQSLATEKELLTQWYEDSLVQISEFNTKELELLGGQNEAKLRLEQEYQSRLAEIQKQQYQGVADAQQGAMSAFQSFMGTLSGMSEGAAKAVLVVNTALSISQAIQNTAVAATRALAELGPVAGPAAAAKIKMYGAAQVGLIAANAALKLGSRGGGSGGGSGGGGGGRIATPATAAATPQRVLIQGIGPNDLITGSQLSEIFDKLYEENENRGLVFQIAS